jgi:hypothetical protein
MIVRYSTSARRRGVFVLLATLALWLAVSATHIHLDDDADGSSGTSAQCAVCLSLPTAAPPPALFATFASTVCATRVAAPGAVEPVLQDVPSSYRSRAPPV